MLLLVAAFCALLATGHLLPAALVRQRAVAALPATLAFAAAARLLRGVTASGAVAGWAVALLLWLGAGWQGFAALLAVFVVTFVATRFGYARKQKLGTAERRGGRDGTQVVANVGLAALLVVIAPPFWMVGVVAVLCEAAADTVSSEIGQAIGGMPRLITNLRPAPAGTDGAISVTGTLAGVLAAAAIGAAATWLRLLPLAHAAVAAVAGSAGMLFDSLLGATLERRGNMDNDQVNGASTVFAALLAALAMYGFGWR